MPVPEKLKKQVDNLPFKPGIYKFSDDKGKIIYIGKAKELRKRVRSYFTSAKQTGKIQVLVSRISNIDYVLVDNEFDAFLLENSLIKKHQPRYNVNLKDGKTYPFICVKNERFPRVFPTRQFIRDGSEYFGPYASVSLMHLVLDVIKKLFPVRSCNLNLSEENIQNGRFKVCLDYHINLCKGPCEGLQSEKDYNQNIHHIRKILNGNTSVVVKHLKSEMEKASEQLDFERAQELKDKIEKLEHFQAKSTVVNPRIHNVDVFSIYSTDKVAFVNYLRVVNGAIVQTYSIEFRKKLNEEDKKILSLAIADIKDRFKSRSTEIIVPFDLSMGRNDADKPFKFTVPKQGDKKKLLELSYKNVRHYAYERMRDISQKVSRTTPLLEELKAKLNLVELPEYIECFDNSHIQGDQPVSALVVFKNGKPSKRDYRLFNLKTVDKPDDYAGMEEAVYRHYKRIIDEEKQLPALLIIDGGKGQLSAAVKSLERLGLEDRIAVRSIAKKLEEIYQPGDPYPLHLDKKSETLKLIQHLRNEAHRFAIKHHRNRKVKSSLQSELTEVSGIGEQSAKKLLRHFKSKKNILAAGNDKIAEIVGKDRAKRIIEYFQE